MWIIYLKSRGMRIGKGSRIFPSLDLFKCRLTNVQLGCSVTIGRRAWISTVAGNSEIFIGNNVVIGRDCVIAAAKQITIGPTCLFSFRVTVLDHDHNFGGEGNNKSQIHEVGATSPVHIGKECFVGSDVKILKGVTLGDGCIVGAGSVVTRSFPQHSILAGNPARVLSYRRLT